MTDEAAAVYEPPDRTVRITAQYAPAQIGRVVPPGHPETVEIELTGAAVPANPANQGYYIRELVDSLFRVEDKTVTIEPHVHGVLSDGATITFPTGVRTR